MDKITTRSRLEVIWSTNPGDVGYEGRKIDWATAKADFYGSPRQCLDYIAKVRHNVGEGALMAIRLRHHGKLIEDSSRASEQLAQVLAGF